MWTHLRIYQPINQATPNHCYKLFKLFKTYQIGLNKKLKIFNKTRRFEPPSNIVNKGLEVNFHLLQP